MSERVNPSDVADESFVDRSGAEPEPEQRETDDVAETSTEGGGSVSPVDMAMRTEVPSGADPESVARQYGVGKGAALVLFGFMKASGSGGMPAIGDIGLGSLLMFKDQTAEKENSGADSSAEESTDSTDSRPGSDLEVVSSE